MNTTMIMSHTLGSICYSVSLPLFSAALLAQIPHTIKVPDATAIRLSLTEPLSSATNEVDDPVRFEVTEDVKEGDLVVIPKGSTAVGHVVEVEPKRRMGRAGKLNFAIDHVKGIDGSNLRLRASSTRKGDDKTGSVIVGTVLLSPLFLIMRGKDISIPKGTNVTAYVDGDREIALGHAETTATVSQASHRDAPTPPAVKTQEPSTVVVKSAPDGGDIVVDGKFVGNTPSTVQLSPGDHLISIQKSGFTLWKRNVAVTPGGIITLNGVLEKD